MIKIINWGKYQSYKDRRPPWIRFHRTMIDNYEFQMMSADARALLPMFWLLACEDEDPKSGEIKYSIKEISFRLRQTKKTITTVIKALQVAGFITCNETVMKLCKDSSISVTTETETETETEVKKKKATLPTVEDVKLYFKENGYKESAGENAFHYYNDNDWEDINGKKVKNWKMKMRGVWFKDNAKETGTTSGRVTDYENGIEIGFTEDGIKYDIDGFQR